MGARGVFVVIAGPDGTGKTTVLDALVEDELGTKVLQLHHRPRVLGGRAQHDGPVTEPHREEHYPRGVSGIKLLYLYVDHLLGWLWRVHPWLRAGGDVVLERGWWDLAVDPRRYRLRPNRVLVHLLGRLLPRPDVTLVLGGDPAVIAARKAELPVEETRRQLDAWHELPSSVLRAVTVDTDRPLNEVRGAVTTAVRAVRLPERWVVLPSRRRPRWYLPPSPRRHVVAALSLYEPVTTRGRLGWRSARRIAATGAFRLVATRTARPPGEVLELVARHVPPAGQVAIARGRHAGRMTALILGADGLPVSFAKVALDADGPAVLAAEADAGELLRPLLPPGLHAPELRHREPHLLLFEAVTAMPRSRPWALPPDVAFLLGQLHGAGRQPDGRGPAHGDCAPWNLLRTARGWYLVDWADARLDAAPFEDVVHFLVQAHALLRRPRRQELVAALQGCGRSAALLARYAEGAALDPASAGSAAVDYLTRTCAAMDTRARDGRQGARARRALLAALAPGGRT
ncbi:hypothetical protein [Nitriliruptor alkaliphilus]|uniref:hypothetical protein n=1 Tax=Nitriliruptor alkaliphilus TaxID=427918 RepID=UPI00069721AC|nr:hypothetical protein [Nitriliruptor alkaliphilus]